MRCLSRFLFVLFLTLVDSAHSQSETVLHHFIKEGCEIAQLVAGDGTSTLFLGRPGAPDLSLVSGIQSVRLVRRPSAGTPLTFFDLAPDNVPLAEKSSGALAAFWLDGRLHVFNHFGEMASFSPDWVKENLASREPELSVVALETFTPVPDASAPLMGSLLLYGAERGRIAQLPHTLDKAWSYPLEQMSGLTLFTHYSLLPIIVSIDSRLETQSALVQPLVWEDGKAPAAGNCSGGTCGVPTVMGEVQTLLKNQPQFKGRVAPINARPIAIGKHFSSRTSTKPPTKKGPKGSSKKTSQGEMADEILADFGEEAILTQMLSAFELGKSVLLVGEFGSVSDSILAMIEARLAKVRPRKYLETLTSVDLKTGPYVGGLQDMVENRLLKPAKERRTIFSLVDAETLVGKGRYRGSDVDFYDELRPYLSHKKTPLQFLFTTTSAGQLALPDFIVSHPNVQLIRVGDPSADPGFSRKMASRAMQRWGLVLSVSQIDQIRTLAGKYEAGLAEPGRTEKLLETISTQAEQEAITSPSSDFIRLCLAEHYQEPAWKRDRQAARELVTRFVPRMNSHYLGAEAEKTVVRSLLRTQLFGGGASGKPRGRLLMVGLPGVGKTSFAHAISYAIRGKRATVVDMSIYSEPGSAEKFANALAAALLADPYDVLVFNEPEAAHVEVQQVLLDVMENPRLRANIGGKAKTVSAEESWWFFASNAANGYLQRLLALGNIPTREEVGQYLKNPLEEERSNRLLPAFADRCLVMSMWGPKEQRIFEKIVEQHLRQILAQLRTGDYPREYEFPESITFVRDWTQVTGSFTPGYGVRSAVDQIELTAQIAAAQRNMNDVDVSVPCSFSIADFRLAWLELNPPTGEHPWTADGE